MIIEKYFNFDTKVQLTKKLCKYKIGIFSQYKYLLTGDRPSLFLHNLLCPQVQPTMDVQIDLKCKSNSLQYNLISNTMIKMQSMAKVANTKLITAVLFPKLERKKNEHECFYILTTHSHINKCFFVYNL